MSSPARDRIKVPAGLWRGFRLVGADPVAMVRRAQLPVAIIAEGRELSTEQYFALWDTVPDLASTGAAGLLIARQFETTAMPPAFLAAYFARDLRDALKRVARFKQLCAPEQVRFTEKGDSFSISVEWTHSRRSTPMALVDATLASLIEVGRRGTQERLVARELHLARTPGDSRAYESYFGCTVRFAARQNRLVLARADLDRPFSSHNVEMLEMLGPPLSHALEQQRHSVAAQVTWLLQRRMAGGALEVGSVASEMGLSERTLQRRIADEGTSYQALITKTRQEMAQRYLAEQTLDLKEVAALLGYEDQNSFYRAFRRWEGQTPSSWRASKQRAVSR